MFRRNDKSVQQRCCRHGTDNYKLLHIKYTHIQQSNNHEITNKHNSNYITINIKYQLNMSKNKRLSNVN